MRYMLLIYGAEGALDEASREACYKESVALTHEINATGQFLAAAPLQSVSTARSVRLRGGKRLVTDGPFAETREHLGGYYLVDAASVDDAIEIAAKIPGARWGTVEVRPVVELEGMPEV